MQPAEEYSWTTYDEVIRRALELIAPRSVVDFGAGAGKYGRMARAASPQAVLSAVEVDPDTVAGHGLPAVYDEIIAADASRLITEHPLRRWDVAILGDVIEHLKKSDGIDLLNWLTYRAAYTLVVTPEAMPMHRDPWWEGHNSVWTERDFAWHDNWASHRLQQQQLFILRGYPANPLKLEQLVRELNESGITVELEGWCAPLSLQHHLSVTTVTEDHGDGTATVLWWREF
jgi:hypothetical protein